MFGRSVLAVRRLDDRILPAATLHYTDVDGDVVTVRTSAGTDSDLSFAARFDVNHHQLQTLLLSLNAFQGTSVSVTATPGPAGGDGLVNIGHIDATGINLGAVTVHGDLGRIDAGTGGANAVAVRSLTAVSMGRFGITTQDVSPSLFSNLHGALGKMNVHGDLDAVTLDITGPNGQAGAIHVGGSLIGGGLTGAIRTAGKMGPVLIGGDVVGGGFNFNGTDIPTGVIACGGKLVGLTIGGSLIGSSFDGSGQVNLAGDAGPIRVGGDLVGGDGVYSGSIYDNGAGTVASVFIAGSLAPGPSLGASGGVDMSNDTVGAVTIGGNLRSYINLTRSASVVVHGFVGESKITDYITGNTLGDVRIGGSLTGEITAVRIGSLTVGGSVQGRIWASDSIGRLVIRGSLVNSSVGVYGPKVPDGTPCVGIGSLTVFGRVEQSQILAGFDPSKIFGNGDVQIGAVTVRGDWIASDLAAGIYPGSKSLIFGDADDQKVTGGGQTDHPNSHSRIGPIVIQGQLLGTPGNATTNGIEAEELVSLSVGGTAIHLKPGRSNDTIAIPLGEAGDVVAREF